VHESALTDTQVMDRYTSRPAISSYSSSNRLDASYVGDGTVSTTELGYLNGVTSSVQTQLDSKHPTINSGNRLDAAFLGDGTVSNTELGYLNGSTSSLQTQINTLASASGFNATQLGEGSTVGNHAVNLATGSKMNNAALIALDGASTSANAEHVIMTDGSGNLSWSQGVKSGAQSNDDYSIAIGTTTQTIAASPYSNTLVLNATNTPLQRMRNNATYIDPIRQASLSEFSSLKHIFWNPTSKELVWLAIIPAHAYNFNDSANTFVDPTLTFVDGRTATANVTGTIEWSATDGITTPAGGALQLPSVKIESVFSIEVMLRFNSATAWHNVFAFYNAPGVDAIAMMRGASANQLNVAITHSGLQQYFLTPVMSQFGVSTSFVHVVLTRDSSGTLTMWVDGVQVTPNSAGGTVVIQPVIRTYHFIGKSPTGDSGDETIKYLRLYNYAINSTDIATLYANR
jgi:hypothetical protein